MFPSQGAQSVEKSLQSPLSMAANGTANTFDLDAHKRFPLKFESEGKCAIVATRGQSDQPGFKVRELHLPCTLATPTP